MDLALYYHCDDLARNPGERPISLTRDLNPKFLRRCRERKESLSVREKVTVSSLLPSEHGTDTFRHVLDREMFYGLIKDYVETTGTRARRRSPPN